VNCRNVFRGLNRRIRSGTADPDRGSVGVYVVALTLGMLVMAGLVLDGGAAFAARGAAATAAQQAARAGADALDPLSLRSTDPTGVTVNAAAARIAASRALAAAGATGTIQIDGTAVTVTARISRPSYVLSVVGVDRLTGTGSFTAVPVHGTTTGSG
jgi:Flp pilus assembly protein TadG